MGLCRDSDFGKASFPNFTLIPLGMKHCFWHSVRKKMCEWYLVSFSVALDSATSLPFRFAGVILLDPVKDAEEFSFVVDINNRGPAMRRRSRTATLAWIAFDDTLCCSMYE